MVGIDLTGKNVLITGGASGIGKASAESFTASGARVAVTDIDRDGIQETVRGLGNEHFAIDGDNSKKNDVDKIIKAAGEALGNIDILDGNIYVHRITCNGNNDLNRKVFYPFITFDELKIAYYLFEGAIYKLQYK